jgi:hypothetical protein
MYTLALKLKNTSTCVYINILAPTTLFVNENWQKSISVLDIIWLYI